MPNTEPAHILITGASSGIGAALALAYARPGAHLSLGGRSRERLAGIAAQASARGASTSSDAIDVCDREAVADWVLAAESRAPLDLVIANAGISGGTHGGPENAEQTRAIFAVNLDGVLNVTLPIIPRMISRKSGQIAIISSLAEHGTLPAAEVYFSLKAQSANRGELDLESFIANRPQSLVRNRAGRFQLFRVGDAVASRNIHAALYESLRLCLQF
jgi:NADP-dependent 3-hydroxy acid dehydrogenase YdfG